MEKKLNPLLLVDEPHDEPLEPPEKHRPDEMPIEGHPAFVSSGEDQYWREYYSSRQFYGRDYDEYQPAFQYGWETGLNLQYKEKSFAEIEAELERQWPAYCSSSRKDWPYMRWAVEAAFNRTRQKLV
jgi:hypothetical protein